MDNLEPITRNEMFLNGDDLEPITREEMILAGADLDPITRHEWFLKKYRGGGGGGEYDLVNIPDLPADIASFNDGTDLPMASLKVSVTPYQDLSHGDPSPENICPIIGWDEAVVSVTGINIWDEEWENGRFNAITGSKAYGNGIRSKNMISVIPSETIYVLRGDYEGASSNILFYYDANKEFISYEVKSGTKAVFTTPSNCHFINFNVQTSAEVTTYNNDISINYPSTDTSYHAYNGATYTIDLNGTRYGGTLDATNGTMTVDIKYEVYDGSSDETWYTYSNSGFRIPKDDIDASNVGICNIAPKSTSASTYGVSFSASNNYIYFFQSVSAWGVSTVEELRAWLANNNIQVCYELATPITVQLAPQPVKSIEGENNISANCGQITEVKYFKKA